MGQLRTGARRRRACRRGCGRQARWYAKEHTGIIQSLRELTAGRFRDGGVARVLVMEFWTGGKAPTLADFARAWTKANANKHRLVTAEYAYLTDLEHKRAGGKWKSLRKANAKSALQTHARIAEAFMLEIGAEHPGHEVDGVRPADPSRSSS